MSHPPAALGAGGDADIAAIGALVADPARCRILLALDDGRALPASGLAAEAGVSPATASSHLRKLTDAGLLAVEAHGRHRYYRLAGPAVGHLIEALQQLAPAQPVRSLRQGARANALREGRTCYDHLAGRLGVTLMAAMLKRGYLEGGDGLFHPETARHDNRRGYGHDVDYRLTADGRTFLTDFGVHLPQRRPAIRYCVDWSEQRHHLAGALGRGMLDRVTELGWLQRANGTRAVQLTDTGKTGLAKTFGLQEPARPPADRTPAGRRQPVKAAAPSAEVGGGRITRTRSAAYPAVPVPALLAVVSVCVGLTSCSSARPDSIRLLRRAMHRKMYYVKRSNEDPGRWSDPPLLVLASLAEGAKHGLTGKISYSELYFCEAYWPAFREIDLLRALRSFAARQRRYGA